jgi:tungstate transport system substrate-binding protein
VQGKYNLGSKHVITLLVWCLLLSTVCIGCDNTAKQSSSSQGKAASPETTLKGRIILATTTSTQDSGLLEELLPHFTQKTGWEVNTIAVGTGEALKMGENGEADVLLVHAKAREEAFIKEGYGLKRYDVMYNDFVIVGPKGEIANNADVEATFKTIFDNQYTFVSRGDESGTHTKELSLWEKLSIIPTENPNYITAGQGMGSALLMAEEKRGYTLSDRATWLTAKQKTTMDVVCEKDTGLLNQYGVIAVNPKINEKINAEGAQDFVEWILSQEVQNLIESFGVQEYGESLFTPNAIANK